MNGINLKGFEVRSFTIRGLTAKWGIGENRVPPMWDTNLIGYWDARGLPNGEVSTIANKATLATKAPALAVTGATMADGTLQFDGVDDGAYTEAFAFPNEFTIFWDVDWLGSENKDAGIAHPSDLYLYNRPSSEKIKCFVKDGANPALIPNTSVGLSTNGNIYALNGSITSFGGTVGTDTGNTALRIGYIPWSGTFTQMGLRQLLIFNKELTQAEVNDVLHVMFSV